MANYKSAISFGLVHIPVSLAPVIRDNDAAFNLLHKKCMERIKQVKYCPVCNEEVTQDELIKGYQYTKGSYVTFTDEDFKKIKSEDDKTLEIISFIDLKEIDSIYYEKSYYLKTDGKNKAFTLFKEALNKTKKVALARTVLGNKSFYATIRTGKEHIIMSTLYFFEEVQNIEEKPDLNFSSQELSLAIKLIESMSGKFEPQKYKDEYQNKVREAIDDKVHGKDIKAPKRKKQENVSNLMEALEKSLKNGKKKK